MTAAKTVRCQEQTLGGLEKISWLGAEPKRAYIEVLRGVRLWLRCDGSPTDGLQEIKTERGADDLEGAKP